MLSASTTTRSPAPGLSLPGLLNGRGYRDEAFDRLYDEGIQVAWMAHFSTPREILDTLTLLEPYDGDRFFFEDELDGIEAELAEAVAGRVAG